MKKSTVYKIMAMKARFGATSVSDKNKGKTPPKWASTDKKIEIDEASREIANAIKEDKSEEQKQTEDTKTEEQKQADAAAAAVGKADGTELTDTDINKLETAGAAKEVIANLRKVAKENQQLKADLKAKVDALTAAGITDLAELGTKKKVVSADDYAGLSKRAEENENLVKRISIQHHPEFKAQVLKPIADTAQAIESILTENEIADKQGVINILATPPSKARNDALVKVLGGISEFSKMAFVQKVGELDALNAKRIALIQKSDAELKAYNEELDRAHAFRSTPEQAQLEAALTAQVSSPDNLWFRQKPVDGLTGETLEETKRHNAVVESNRAKARRLLLEKTNKPGELADMVNKAVGYEVLRPTVDVLQEQLRLKDEEIAALKKAMPGGGTGSAGRSGSGSSANVPDFKRGPINWMTLAEGMVSKFK